MKKLYLEVGMPILTGMEKYVDYLQNKHWEDLKATGDFDTEAEPIFDFTMDENKQQGVIVSCFPLQSEESKQNYEETNRSSVGQKYLRDINELGIITAEKSLLRRYIWM